METTETITCPFGHTTTPEKLFDRQDWWFQLPGDFAWQRCPDCGLLFLSPRPTIETITDYYPDRYAAYRPAIEDEKWFFMRWKRRRNLRRSIQAVNRRAEIGRLLDVGCATGNYLAEMQRFGWSVAGVEIQAEAAEYARARFGFDVFTGDLLASNLPAHSFDVVTLWDVLEHTHYPIAILQEAHRVIKPGGLLVFSIPDPTAVWADRFGPAWIGYDTPRHLYLFHGDSLALLLNQTGFSLVERQHFLATYHTWVASFHTWLNWRMPDSWRRRLILKLAYLPFWSVITAPYFRRLNRNGRATDMTIYAKATSS